MIGADHHPGAVDMGSRYVDTIEMSTEYLDDYLRNRQIFMLSRTLTGLIK